MKSNHHILRMIPSEKLDSGNANVCMMNITRTVLLNSVSSPTLIRDRFHWLPVSVASPNRSFPLAAGSNGNSKSNSILLFTPRSLSNSPHRWLTSEHFQLPVSTHCSAIVDWRRELRQLSLTIPRDFVTSRLNPCSLDRCNVFSA